MTASWPDCAHVGEIDRQRAEYGRGGDYVEDGPDGPGVVEVPKKKWAVYSAEYASISPQANRVIMPMTISCGLEAIPPLSDGPARPSRSHPIPSPPVRRTG